MHNHSQIWQAVLMRHSRVHWGMLFWPRLLLLTPLLLVCGGCDGGLSLAALGTVLGAAGSAYSTGKAVYSLGKLDSAELATLDESANAARTAATELGLAASPNCKRQKDPSVIELPFEDDKEARIDIRLERRAAHMVRVRIDVGLFGSELTARLVLERMRMHLPSAMETRRLENRP